MSEKVILKALAGLQRNRVATIRPCCVLLSVCCLSVTGTYAQGIPDALVTNKEEAAVAKHRLTVENVRKLFAVERELLGLMKHIPDLDTRMIELGTRIDPQRREHSLVVEAKVCAGIPEIAQILQRQKISAREYVLTKMVATGAEMSDEALNSEVLQREENSEVAQFMMRSQSLQFWRSMDPALKAEAEEWKRVRGEMEKYGSSTGGR